MRSFVVFGLLASSVFAAPVKRALTTPLTNLPVVGDVVKAAGSALEPVESLASPVIGELESLPAAGGTVKSIADSAVSIASNVRREPEPQDLSAVNGAVNGVAGGLIGVVNGAVGSISGATKDIPVVGDLADPVISTVSGVANVPINAINSVSAASNLRREPEPQDLGAVSGVVNSVAGGLIGTVNGVGGGVFGATKNIPVAGDLAAPIESTVSGVANIPINVVNSVSAQGLPLPLA